MFLKHLNCGDNVGILHRRHRRVLLKKRPASQFGKTGRIDGRIDGRRRGYVREAGAHRRGRPQ